MKKVVVFWNNGINQKHEIKQEQLAAMRKVIALKKGKINAIVYI